MIIRTIEDCKEWNEILLLVNEEDGILFFVKLWKDNCLPCKKLQEEIEEYGKSHDIFLISAKISHRDFFQRVKESGVVKVPRLVVFKNGQVVYDQYGSKLITKKLEGIC